MLSGEPPFPPTEILELAEQHRHAPPPDIRAANPEVSDAVGEIISRCLQKRSDLRYLNPSDLIADLHRVQFGATDSHRVASTDSPMRFKSVADVSV